MFLAIISCASPTVVNVIGPNDSKMNCEELSAEILKANKYANEAQEAKKTGKPHNIGAILWNLFEEAKRLWNYIKKCKEKRAAKLKQHKDRDFFDL